MDKNMDKNDNENSVYYLNELQESGKLRDLIEYEEVIPIEVEIALDRLEKQFNKENLLEYFRTLDNWEEMIQDDYIGDLCEIIKEEPEHIVVEFSQPDNPRNKNICTYFLA